MSVLEVFARMESLPLMSGSCTAWDIATAADMVLPDHCCWYGVGCCTPQTCGNDPFCNCTMGLVSSLSLSANQASRNMETIGRE